MSKRSHHRYSGINVGELAEALTRQGWQPPQPNIPMNGMMPPMNSGNPPNGGNPIPGNLQALSGLLGAVNGGNPPAAPMMPQPQMMPQHRQNRAQPQHQTTDNDLLRSLFQQVLNELRRP